MSTYLNGTLGLAVLFALAIVLTIARPNITRETGVLRRASITIIATLAAQVLHFAEELGTQFYVRFPVELGLQPWSKRFFVVFNVVWLAVWVASLLAVRARLVPALVPLWFLGLAMALNGVAHPVLALRAGGYFPGLATTPIVALGGGILLYQLFRVTSGERRAA